MWIYFPSEQGELFFNHYHKITLFLEMRPWRGLDWTKNRTYLDISA